MNAIAKKFVKHTSRNLIKNSIEISTQQLVFIQLKSHTDWYVGFREFFYSYQPSMLNDPLHRPNKLDYFKSITRINCNVVVSIVNFKTFPLNFKWNATYNVISECLGKMFQILEIRINGKFSNSKCFMDGQQQKEEH